MEVKNLNSKLEDEQSLVAQLQRKIKELQVNMRVIHCRNDILITERVDQYKV